MNDIDKSIYAKKAMDLFKRNRRAIKLTERITSETFMDIDNDILIKI